MSETLSFDTELQALRERAIDRLLNTDAFDGDAFGSLAQYLNRKADALRAEYVIPKQVLACLRDASSAIRSRAEYLPEVRTHAEIADRFDMLLDLMIIGETMEDRVLGRVY
jgi:hypothetical protein